MNKYQKQAQDFAEANNLTMQTIYKGHYARFGDSITAVYSIILARPNKKPMQFDFSASINDSYKYAETGTFNYRKGLPLKLDYGKWFKNGRQTHPAYIICETKTPPTLYDVLACLTKYDLETFKDFCMAYGYKDSRKAYETFLAVDKEWHEVKQMFSDCLEELQEIN